MTSRVCGVGNAGHERGEQNGHWCQGKERGVIIIPPDLAHSAQRMFLLETDLSACVGAACMTHSADYKAHADPTDPHTRV